MFIRQKLDWLVVPLLLAGIFAYASYRPRSRLTPDMPQEFIDFGTIQKRIAEQKIAQAYWNCAVRDIQWKYGYGHPLPADPPAEFAIAWVDLGETASAANRIRYWNNLRHLWYVPSVWRQQYVWDFTWIGTNWVTSAGRWLGERFSGTAN